MRRAALDSSVLHPAPVRDLLLRAACAGLFEARVSLQTVERYVEERLAERPDLSVEAFTRTRALLTIGLPTIALDAAPALLGEAPVSAPRQRAALAAAVLAEADVILSREPEAYDEETLASFGIEARHPDDFLLPLVAQAPTKLFALVSEQAHAVPDAPLSLAALLRTLKAQGLPRAIDELCAHYYGAAV